MRLIYQRGMSVTLSFAIFCTGCMKTRVATVGRFEQPITASAQPVKVAGIYTAKWTDSDHNHLHTIHNSSRLVSKGDVLGFERGADGQLLGVHGDRRIEFASAPANAKYVVWYHKEVVPTQFGKEVQKTGDGTVQVLKIVGVTVLLVAVVAGLLYLNSQDDAGGCHSTH